MLTQDRFELKCAVYGILQKPTGEIFMLRRFNTGYGDGLFIPPSGHIDGNETATSAAIREIKEEAGVDARPEDMEMIHVMHRMGLDERVEFYFLVKKWQGEPHLAEPDKSDEVMWVSPQNLPENTVDYISFFFDQLKDGKIYSEFGWK